jgi:site-specific DNA-methyltransferase (adenine-specific)
MSYEIFHADAFGWLANCEPHSIEAVVTDPPFGVREFDSDHLARSEVARGGNWRIPQTTGGANRQAVPRFSTVTAKESEQVALYFEAFGALVHRVLVPGGHLIIANTPLLSDFMYDGLRKAGLEKRGEVVRVVKTIRGGDRPKLAEAEFPDVSVMPRGHWEPWGVFGSPITERAVAENLRVYGTGALRRPSRDAPFADVIVSAVANKRERLIANHPSIKPQEFMRKIVRAALPLGTGTVLDPFMGSGSTIAAAEFLGYKAIGVERDQEFFEMAREGIPLLAAIRLADDPIDDRAA